MKNKFARILSILLVLSVILASPSFAHSGRTDSRGGHKDNKNKSGLGSYHYHCGGYPAHLHNGGICPYAPKDTISVSNMPTKLFVGDSVKLEWKVTYYSGRSYVDWKSSDEAVVKVSSSGVLTAIAPGKATITATLFNGEKKNNITISNRSIDKIELSVPSNDTCIGSVFYVSPHISPDNATDKRIEWNSDNEDVAVVMDDGLVIVIGEGIAKITANSLDGSGRKSSVTISSVMDEDVVIDTTNILNQLPLGYTFSVKPGSNAAQFAKKYNLPREFAVPVDLPLKIGSKSTTVKDIQKALIATGYLNDKADGIFGKNTDAAIARFCAANGITYTGTVNFFCYVTIMESAIIEP